MTKVEKSAVLLSCQAEGCSNTFETLFEEGLPEAARSLQAALESHKAGWHAVSGPILCPQCARKLAPNKPAGSI
jgi:hypothetical protein